MNFYKSWFFNIINALYLVKVSFILHDSCKAIDYVHNRSLNNHFFFILLSSLLQMTGLLV